MVVDFIILILLVPCSKSLTQPNAISQTNDMICIQIQHSVNTTIMAWRVSNNYSDRSSVLDFYLDPFLRTLRHPFLRRFSNNNHRRLPCFLSLLKANPCDLVQYRGKICCTSEIKFFTSVIGEALGKPPPLPSLL